MGQKRISRGFQTDINILYRNFNNKGLLKIKKILVYLLSNLSMYLKVVAAQSCLTLCDPTDYIVHGILQARILEWVAFPFSRGSCQPRD